MQPLMQVSGHSRAGWDREEQSLLWNQVTTTREAGQPLKQAFENMARLTGRKPNSIRNFYYAKVKEGEFTPTGERSAFTPFSDQEIEMLLESVLCAQARGLSVRSITMQLGNGDRKAMLRYQNKYRSLIKNSPEAVFAALDRLRARNEPWYDPYSQPRVHKAGRKPGTKRKPNVDDMLRTLGENLKCVKDIDATLLVSQLVALTNIAAQTSKRA
jgi:hypothetical protein